MSNDSIIALNVLSLAVQQNRHLRVQCRALIGGRYALGRYQACATLNCDSHDADSARQHTFLFPMRAIEPEIGLLRCSTNA